MPILIRCPLMSSALTYEESHFKTSTYSSLVTDNVLSLVTTISINISSHYRCTNKSISIMSLSCITIAAHFIRHNTQITRATRCSKNRNNSTVHSLVFHMTRVRRVQRIFSTVDLSQTVSVTESRQTETENK